MANGTQPATTAQPVACALIGGEWRTSDTLRDIRDPYRGDTVGKMAVSSSGDLDDALSAAVRARDAAAALPGWANGGEKSTRPAEGDKPSRQGK